MRYLLTCILSLYLANCLGQAHNIAGTYSNGNAVWNLTITFNTDSTFIYKSSKNPNFHGWEQFSEQGKWIITADTIILNPQLVRKPFTEYDFREDVTENDTALYLTVNHIRRHYDNNGNLVSQDTTQAAMLDYAFNNFKKQQRTRIADYYTTPCAFGGYIPKQVITTERTIAIPRPTAAIKSIIISCSELNGRKEFKISSANTNHLTLNIFSNYHQDGQLRQQHIWIQNDKTLYSQRKPNGKLSKGSWGFRTMLKKEKKAYTAVLSSQL